MQPFEEDPDFQALPPDRQRAFRQGMVGQLVADPDFLALEQGRREGILREVAGVPATPPQSMLGRVGSAAAGLGGRMLGAAKASLGNDVSQLTTMPRTGLDVAAWPGRALMSAVDLAMLGTPSGLGEPVKEQFERRGLPGTGAMVGPLFGGVALGPLVGAAARPLGRAMRPDLGPPVAQGLQEAGAELRTPPQTPAPTPAPVPPEPLGQMPLSLTREVPLPPPGLRTRVEAAPPNLVAERGLPTQPDLVPVPGQQWEGGGVYEPRFGKPPVDPLGQNELPLTRQRPVPPPRELAAEVPEGPVLAPPHEPVGGRSGAPQAAVFDPNTPPQWPQQVTWVDRLWKTTRNLTDKLPFEKRIAMRIPGSPVISDTEALQVNQTGALRQFLGGEVNGAVRKLSPNEWVDADSAAHTGAPVDPNAAAYFAYRRSRVPIEQHARELLGLDDINWLDTEYLPRLVQQSADTINRLGRKGWVYGEGLRTNLGSFGQDRQFPTMAEGLNAGVRYEDPRLAIARREWVSFQLEHSTNFVDGLRQKGVIFERPEAAAAAGVLRPEPLAFVPNGRTWFVRSHEEAQFLRHQFQERTSPLGQFGWVLNSLFRNPNLYNPIPHETFNMGTKYLLASNERSVNLPRDLLEYRQGSDPQTLALFNQYMPFEKTGQTAYQMLADATRPYQSPATLGQSAKLVAQDALKVASYPNKWSAKHIFTQADPAMRYSLFKNYLRQGLDPQAAANHSWVDLVRYSSRSDYTDFLKSIPMNFFVSWRYGAVTSFLKQVQTHAIRTAMLVGAIDYARDAVYRQTGWWKHLPYDSVLAPVARLIETGDPVAAGKTGALTLALGPGGEYTFKTLRDATEALATSQDPRAQSDFERLRYLFWGVGQLVGAGEEANAYWKTGDETHLRNIFFSVLGAHPALTYHPPNLTSALASRVPWLEALRVRPSPEVAQAEQLQAMAKTRQEKTAATAAVRPRPTGTEQEKQMQRLRHRAGLQ